MEIPGTLQTEESLRQFTKGLLAEWIGLLETGTLPIAIPKLRGIMSVQPGKTFHLRPELFLQLTGETIFHFPEETLHVGPRSLCLVPRGMPHEEHAGPKEGPFVNLVFMFPNAQELFFHIAYEGPHGRPQGHTGTRVHGQFRAATLLLDEATSLAQQSSAMRESAIKGLILAHLAMLHAVLDGEAPASEEEPFKVMQARQWVLRSLPDPRLSPSFLARQLQCNADYLSHLFRQNTGMPLQVYINQQRLQRAYELLENSTLNIAQISEATGFSDPSYFSRAFRKWADVTPREHRLKSRAGV